MKTEEEFCEDYLILEPREGGMFDLFRLLISNNMAESKYVECPKGTMITSFRRRWIVFVAVVLQKILLALTKPMSWIGERFEMGLNLLSMNGSLAEVFLNFLQGTLVMPDSTSATFRSTIGNVDTRVQLDKHIKYGDSGYCEGLSMMASKLSYENEALIKATVTDQWKMEFLGFYNFWNDYQETLSTQAFMFRDTNPDHDLIVVAFRGTDPFDAYSWRTDADITWYNLPNVGRVHGGFMRALGLQKSKGWPKEIIEPTNNNHQYAYYSLREKLRDLLQKNEGSKFIVTGFSLGGALAVLFLMVLILHDEEWLLKKLDAVYTFGQPRVGDEKLGEFMKRGLSVHEVKYIRYVYGNDIVPKLPMVDPALTFKHFGTCLYYDSCYYGKMVEEEPNKNYFSVLMVIPKILNAAWELVRSFIIEYLKGDDYKEGLLLRLLRVVGLIIPGISAHSPQDYVNATRLGSTLMVEEMSRLLKI